MIGISTVERLWLAISGVVLVAFLVILLITSVAMGATPPSSMETVNPTTVLSSGEFAHPGISKTGPHAYTVRVVAFTFGFSPSTITVPAGSTVTFRVASHEVIHGFEIAGTNVNTMVIPGYVSVVTQTFAHKGTYLTLCNEYCGSGHHFMYAHVVVV